jgi:hypothetical protein
LEAAREEGQHRPNNGNDRNDGKDPNDEKDQEDEKDPNDEKDQEDPNDQDRLSIPAVSAESVDQAVSVVLVLFVV